MKKLQRFIYVTISIIALVSAIIIIHRMNENPQFIDLTSYSETIVCNLTNLECDVYLNIRSAHYSTEGLIPQADFLAMLRVRIKNGDCTFQVCNDKKALRHSKSSEQKESIKAKSADVLFNYDLTQKYLEGIYKESVVVNAVEQSGQVIAIINLPGEKLNSNTAFFMIFESGTEKVLYISRIILNEEYSFNGFSTNMYVNKCVVTP